MFATFAAITFIALLLAQLRAVDVAEIRGSLLSLAVAAGFLYWTSTLLPGPVKRLGKSAAERALGATRKKDKK